VIPVSEKSNFIREIILDDVKTNKHNGKVVTRFPPEPNGFLHIGHAKSIFLNYGLAEEFKGTFNLRFDDTDPIKEEMKYVEATKEDIAWLGCDWGENLFFASDYFEKLYEYAVALIKSGKAFVDDLSAEEIEKSRGSLTEPGEESPFRNRTIEENLTLFEKMKKGEFKEGEKVLRAKIDMTASNLNMRDPVLYRIKFANHYRTGDTWCIYPMYDFTHGQSDAIEGITHSLCSLEFENHRPLYDWFIENLPVPSKPRQIEFAKMLFNYTVLSKRNLGRLVKEKYVSGWDDPRMPTVSGLRRRGVTAVALKNLCEAVGVTKRNTILDISIFENHVREDLNKTSPRVMVVLDPIKIVLTNYPEEKIDELEAQNHPENESMGTRKVPFSRELYIEREDFMEEPSKKFFRLAPGREVRLRYAYFITCEKVIKDKKNGEIKELHCTYDPETRGGNASDGRKVKATLHWVSAKHAVKIEARLYDRLYTVEDPQHHEEGKDFTEFINPESLVTVTAYGEPSLKNAKAEERFQFERMGYYCVDRYDSKPEKLVFNKTIGLKDTWAKVKGSK
jgi:glutaminyl-tRNA synthetase